MSILYTILRFVMYNFFILNYVFNIAVIKVILCMFLKHEYEVEYILLEPLFILSLQIVGNLFLTCYYSKHQCFNQSILVHCNCYHFGSSPLVICPSINQNKNEKYHEVRYHSLQDNAKL